MTRTGWRDDFTRLVPGRAQAYDREPDGWHLDMPFENVHGNAGLLTTVGADIHEVRHSGSTAGYRAYLTRFPKPRLSVAVLCNAADAGAGSLADGVAEVFLSPHEHRTEAAARLTAEQREALAVRAGLYRNVHTGEPATLEGAQEGLRFDDRTELVPVSADVFRLGDGDSRLVFETAGRALAPALSFTPATAACPRARRPVEPRTRRAG